MFFIVYFMFLNLNDVMVISMLIIIFNMNSSSDVILMNSVNTEMLPMNAPISSLYIFAFLLSIIDTDSNNRKSNPKFNSSIKSI